MKSSIWTGNRRFPAICAAFVLLAGVGAVQAEAPASAGEPQQMAIAYDDLDLTNAEGRAALQSRVDRGIDKACLMNRSAPSLRQYIEQKRAAQRCKERAQMQAKAHMRLAVEASQAKARLASADAIKVDLPE
ncbi:UrcA family protein [Erythrobacter rubeus]|uniref:UrcA family protein n=1 Tax=Erythrobacter rubeus TaxID=2760803 RepID=A0ABR8KPK2_9SPHN|nr:UrcA family protein [Erythrobacter rubeus]MBD2842575.1 UrcA family protein [Erythrobacter rubeus]